MLLALMFDNIYMRIYDVGLCNDRLKLRIVSNSHFQTHMQVVRMFRK
jgi:hypothetical protein